LNLTALEIAYIAGGFGILGALVGTITAHFLSKDRDRQKDFKIAGSEFKKTFDDKIVRFERAMDEGLGEKITGSVIYKILDRSYNKNLTAYLEFRNHLGRRKRKKFDSVWREYKYPNNYINDGRFGIYIKPDANGNDPPFEPDFVLQKIYALLSYTKP